MGDDCSGRLTSFPASTSNDWTDAAAAFGKFLSVRAVAAVGVRPGTLRFTPNFGMCQRESKDRRQMQ